MKGSRVVVEKIKTLIQDRGLKNSIEFSGAFCMGKCQQGVCVTVDDGFYSVLPETVEAFFEKEVVTRIVG